MRTLSTILAFAFSCLLLNLQTSIAKDVALSTLNSTQCLTFLSTERGSYFGSSVKSAGDVNGDGIDDIVIGALVSDPLYRQNAGVAYVVYGSCKGFDGLNISNMTTSQGFKIIGADNEDRLGAVVSSAGDINGDGLADLLVVATDASPLGRHAAGSAYVIFGSRTPLSDIDLSLGLNHTQGFTIAGAFANKPSDFSASNIGDVNADGFDDIAIGAFFTSPLERHYAGTVYVIFGRRTGITDIDLADLTTTKGFTAIGATEWEDVGLSVSGAGDVNGDGIDDIVIGGRDLAYVLYGSSTGLSDIDMANLNKTQGFKIISNSSHSGSFGRSVSSAGDINGDGIDDIIIGSRDYVYVLYGNWHGFDTIDVAYLTSAQGFSMYSASAYYTLASSVSALGDVNGDGIDDIIIGDPASNGGRAYVIFGSRTGLPNIDLDSPLRASQGFRIIGVSTTDSLGVSVSGAGDFNGDGRNDILVGAEHANNRTGAAYVLFSSAFEELAIQEITV